jgi:hypothetical protein
MKFIQIFLLLFCLVSIVQAQSIEELEANKARLQQQVATLNSELTAVNNAIAALNPPPAWTKGFSGTAGFNFNQLNNWVINPNPNSRTSNILFSLNSFANLTKEKYFWRNSGILNLGWQKLQLDSNADEGSEYQPTVDVLQLTSLYGYNLSKTIAASALAEFRSSVIRNAFNPAYLDIGVGATWKPDNYFVAVFHPLNYNFIFAETGSNFISSLGCKIVADYNREVYKGVRLRSNLTGFLSYKDLNELSNVTWTNGVSLNIFKGLGLGIEYALRINRQETAPADRKDLQSYFILGLSYSI